MIGQAISVDGVSQTAAVTDTGTYPYATVSVWGNTRHANTPGSQVIFRNTNYIGGTPHSLLEYGRDTTIAGIVIDVRTAGIKLNGGHSPISENTS